MGGANWLGLGRRRGLFSGIEAAIIAVCQPFVLRILRMAWAAGGPDGTDGTGYTSTGLGALGDGRSPLHGPPSPASG